jgi:hypothetical protein
MDGSLSKESWGGRGDILTVADVETNQIIDRVYGWNAVVSPDSTKVAYEFRVPPSSGQTRLSPALLVYDLTAPQSSNTQQPLSNDPAQRGVVLYPESHRLAQRYWIVLEEGQPDRQYVSPIAWSLDSKRVAVLEYQAPDSERLVVVDISRGLRRPSVIMVPIDRGEFLDPDFWTSVPQEYANAHPSFKALRFSEEGKSVVITSWANGPFAEKSVTLLTPVANQ